MKILATFLIILTICSYANLKKSVSKSNKSNEKSEAKTELKSEFEGMSGEKDGMSVTYGLGNNKHYVLETTAVSSILIKFNFSKL